MEFRMAQREQNGEFLKLVKFYKINLFGFGVGNRRVAGLEWSRAMADEEISRKKQVVIVAALFVVITTVAVSLLLGWRHVPGLFGEWLGVFAGLISTPFFLEASFVVLGLLIVTSLNSWRRSKEGDEFVYLEQVNGPDVPADLPDQAKWAIYREKPLPPGDLTRLEQAEGAVAIGDFETAAALVAAMSHEELANDGVTEVRLALAESAGKTALAEKLRAEIARRSEPT